MLQNQGSKIKKEKYIRKVGFLCGGIVFGLFFIGVMLLAFNYFKIINIFPFSKKTQINITSTKLTLNSIYEKTIKAGYIILEIAALNNDSFSDLSGRNILASKERIVNGWIDKFGWQNNPVASSGASRVTGIFIKWENITGFDDKYMVIRDMTENQNIKIRVLYGLSSSEEDLENNTILSVDNLDYGPLNNKIKPIEKIDYFKNISDLNLKSIIKIGDIICASIPLNEKLNFIKDEYGVYSAEEIQIRRFGGLKTIQNEIQK